MSMPNELHMPESVPPELREVRICSDCGTPMFALPLLRCPDCGCELRLRAFVYRRHGKYIAECIDLNLLVQAELLGNAVVKLQEEVYGYLKVAFDGTTTKGLVLRPSPLTHRVRYQVDHFFRCLSNRRKRQQRTWKPADTSTYYSRICQC